MYAYKILAALTVSAILAVTMTMPEQLAQSLPGQISQEGESPVVARIGRVVDIIESNNITVAISGSPALVTASYLFPQYEPLLGDLVYVTKQDAQWFVLGTMSGPLNTVLANPSFEDGIVNALPTNWTITSVSTTAGTLTFTKQPLSTVSGGFIGTIRNSSAGVAGTSSSDIFSSAAAAEPGQQWALGYFVTYAVPDVNASLVPQGGFMDINAFIQFLDSGGVLLAETSASYFPIYSAVQNEVYVRTFVTGTGAVSVTSPPGTEAVRVRLRVSMTMHVNSASEIGIDAMLLRHA